MTMTPDKQAADAVRGIVVYRASRMEALLDPLLDLLDSAPPADTLAPHTLVAAHPGIKQWLVRALAQKRGAGGIVANIEIQLPSAWLDTLAVNLLGATAVSVRPWRREVLRWRIHDCLHAIDDPGVTAYLRGDDAARRRFQLADRVAAIYTRHLVYRPDWIKAWTAGRDHVPEPTFLAPLWRQVRQQIGVAHRGELQQQLATQLQRAVLAALPGEPLHVFGVSHLAPTELALLQALARHRLVVLYLPDPCTEYWAGLRSDVSQLRELVALDALPPEADEAFLEQGHPLLASWGRVGQHLMLALPEGADVRQDVRHWRDELRLSPPLNRLQRLQESFRHLDPALIAPGQPGDTGALDDPSLRVHICHTRLRELDVLRDVLLRARSGDGAVAPSDIVVMAPNIRDYVPLLGAVFGAAGKHEGALPYHLADVAVTRSHRIFTAFDSLLALPQSRLTATEIMDLLGVAEIARAFGLDPADHDLVDSCIQRSRIAWGFDAEFRAAFGVPATLENTFAWGMDRLLAGYVLGESNGERMAIRFTDGVRVLPVEGVHGTQAEAVGALDHFLCALATWRIDLAQPRRASAWVARLEALLDTMFCIDLIDTEARDVLAQLRRCIHTLGAQTDDAGLDPLLDFGVVREVLREQLDGVPERQRFLIGGVTFCGMVPQRAIPFQVIAVLGLNDGEFPRAPGDGGLDPMTRHPRLGDRDVRSDDRYLFLETVMSARAQLHLSYVGEGVRDAKPRNPSAPLAELLALLDEHAGLRDDGDKKPDRPWLVRHPLQAFDARYFDASDPRLFSYRTDLARLASDESRHARPFIDSHCVGGKNLTPVPDDLVDTSLANVLGYYRDPAKQLLQRELHLRLDALDDDNLGESEPLEAQFERKERVARRLFLDVVRNPAADFRVPDAPPDWLRLDGLWPPGRVGDKAWHEESEKVQDILDLIHDHPLFAAGLPITTSLPVDCQIGRFRLRGELTRVHRTADEAWLFDVFADKDSESDLGFKQRIGAFVEWALLCLHATSTGAPVRLLLLTKSEKSPWQDALNRCGEALVRAQRDHNETALAERRSDLQRRIEGLLEFHAAAQAQPSWYFPKTSWVAATSMDAAKIESTWSGGFQPGERDYRPGYAAVLGRDARFAPEQPDLRTLLAHARALRELIEFDAGGIAAHV